MTRERGSRAESKNCELLLFPTADRRFGTKVKCPTGQVLALTGTLPLVEIMLILAESAEGGREIAKKQPTLVGSLK